MKISRSRFFALAAEEFIRRHQNREMLQRVAEAYADGLDPQEQALLRAMRHHQRKMAAQREDQHFELTLMQVALEAIPEQRGKRLSLPRSVEQPQRLAHPGRTQVDCVGGGGAATAEKTVAQDGGGARLRG